MKAEDILKRTMELLQARQFNEAMSYIKHQATTIGYDEEVSETELLHEGYDKILNQFAQANLSPETEEDYNELMLQFYNVIQNLCFKLSYPNVNRSARIDVCVEKLLASHSDKDMCALFWEASSSCMYSSEDRSALHQFIMNEDVPVFMRCTILSAVMLYLFIHFDTEMLENIYAYTLDDQPDQIRWQAWVTMFMCALIHSTRIEHCDRIRQQYQFLAESEPDLFISMQLTLLQCKDTETLHDKVAKLMSKKGDEEEKAKKVFQFVAEGADLSYDAFKMMRHMPFFSLPGTSAHWLMPFSIEQEAVKAMLEQKPQARTMIELLSKSLAQSEQDKYGSIMMLIGNDLSVVDQMSGQLKEAGVELDKIVAPSGEILMRNYMHDLYRFFTLSPTGVTLPVSPFRENLDMGRHPWLATALCSTKALKVLGEYLAQHENWDAATVIYSRLVNQENSEFALQRLAYCAEKRQTRNLQLEGDPLIRCNKLYPGNVWTLQHLAGFYRRTGILTAAEIHLQEALEIEPNNTDLLIDLADCYLGMQLFDKALETYFKLDLQREGDVKIQRLIVKCAFLAGNMDTAKKYIQLVLGQRKPIIADWGLAGCIALRGNNIQEMLDCFGHIGSLRSRLATFDSNIDLMTQGGVPEYLITIARDVINKM